MRPPSLTAAALSVVALPFLAAALAAQDAAQGDAITPERISACIEDRSGEGCATLLVRLLVCEQAPGLPGCDEVNAAAEEAELAAEDLEPEVEPRAEGELTDDETADIEELADDDETADDDEAADQDEATDEDADAAEED
jgi:hypothetical protein